MLSTSDWLMLFALSLAQAHLTRLLLQATILDKPRTWLQNKRPFLRSLLACQMCVGFWVALLVTAAQWRHPFLWSIHTLVVAFIGFLAYQLMEKYLPCPGCVSQLDLGGWEEMV